MEIRDCGNRGGNDCPGPVAEGGLWTLDVFYYLLLHGRDFGSFGNGGQACLPTDVRIEGRLREKGPMTLILLMYPILLQPLMDISICEVVRQAGLVIIKNILHWW